MNKKQIKCCPNCEEATPLIMTFYFAGKEFYCPECNSTGEYLGFGIYREATPELIEKLEKGKEKLKEYISKMEQK